MGKIRVLLADDHQIVIEGIKMILDSHEEYEVCAELNNGQEVLDYLASNEVDVAILDINMPVMDGITCSKEIKSRFASTKIILLTMYAQKSFIQEIVKIGIDGCLLKNNTGKELAQAINRVISGSAYYDQLKSFESKEETVNSYKLSSREIEIVNHLANGLSSSQIADTLFISIHTVKTHRKNILKKLNLDNSYELVQYAMNNGLI